MLFFLGCLIPGLPAWAQNDGDADLEEAINLKISATSTRDLDKVAELCESAIEKGLDDDGVEQAKRLWASTWFEYGDQMSKRIFQTAGQDRRWRVYRREALTRLKKVAELSPEMIDAYLLIARLNGLPGGDREAAREAIDKAVEKIQDDNVKLSQALFIRAALTENEEKRLADLNDAVQNDPENLDAIRARGAYYLQQDKADLALDDFKQWLEKEKENLRAYYVISQTLLSMEKYDEAMEILDKALEVDPDAALTYKERAQIRMAQEKTEEALEEYGKAIKLNRKDFESLLFRAQILLDKERLDEALDDVNEVLQIQPGLVPAYRLRSFIHGSMEKYDKAIEDIELLINNDRSNLGYLTQLAMLYNANEEPSRAVRIYSRLIRQLRKDYENPSEDEMANEGVKSLFTSALRGRGDAYLSISKHKEAIDDYNEAMEVNPEDDGILNNLAWVLATSPEDELRDGERSIKLATQACELTDYKAAHILSTLASGYAENGDFEKAREWATKAVDLAETDQQRENLSKELESYKKDEPWRESQNVEKEKEEREKAAEGDDDQADDDPKSDDEDNDDGQSDDGDDDDDDDDLR